MILTVEVRKKESRGQRPFVKYGEKNVVVAVFCYNYAERYIIKEKEIHYRENRNPSDRENEKMKRKYTIVETRT